MADNPEKVDLESPDLAEQKRAAFEELFPGVLADGVLDATRLGELLDTDVTAPADGRERYGLMWAGKQEAVRSLLTPSRGSLTPDLEKSVDFDTAENVFIEGDNLEVLKLMQKAYNDKVKLIYIDPPYNANALVPYKDDYRDPIGAYLRQSDQLDDFGNRVAAVAEFGGRHHSNWLSMMYPRLALARNLLTQDGVLLCSINDAEFGNLLNILREIFGEENHLATFVWNNDGNIEQQSRIKVNHEYIVAFARNEELVSKPTVIDPNVPETSKLYNTEIENSITKNGPANPPSTVQLPAGFPATIDEASIEPRDDSYPHLLDRVLIRGGVLAEPARVRSGWSSRNLLDLFIENRFVPIEDSEGKESRFAITATGAVYLYKKRSESQGHVLTVLRNMGTTKASSSWLESQWGVVFNYPKPERLIQHLVATFSEGDDVVCDFFAGSGTTAHATALQNAEDGGARRCISVNFPEVTTEGSKAREAGFVTVSDITRSRIRGVMASVEGASGQGLRTLAFDRSNFREAVEIEGELDLGESTLAREESDWEAIAAEVLLKEGVALDQPWERHYLTDGQIVVADCVAVILTLELDDEVVKQALDLEPRVVVFLEDGFAGKDPVKGNAVSSAKALGVTMKTV